MRITFLSTPPNLSGGQRVIAIYAQRLAARGHQVEIVCSRRRPPSIVRSAKELLRGRGLPHWANSGQSHYDNYGVEFRIVKHNGRLVDRDIADGDIVIATWWETAEWASDLCPSKGAGVYFVQHYEVVISPRADDRCDATYRLPLKKLCVAQWLADLMRRRFSDAECIVVANAVDSAHFSVPVRERRSPLTVGMVYSSSAWKGSELLIEAIRLARKEIPHLSAVAFGCRAPNDRAVRCVFNEFYTSPPQRQIPEIYARCCAWLFGSRTEGFGLPILEAMACRTPVIGTPAGAAPELILKGGGLLVKPDDPIDMAHAIVRIASMPISEWQAMSAVALQTATSYTWDDAVDRFEAALHAAADGDWEPHYRSQVASNNCDKRADGFL